MQYTPLETPTPPPILSKALRDDPPESVDWRTQGAVNPVKNQNTCGASWAYSATSMVESAHFIASGEAKELLVLSYQ